MKPARVLLCVALLLQCVVQITVAEQLYPPTKKGETGDDDDELANAPWDEETSADEDDGPPAKDAENDKDDAEVRENKELDEKVAKMPLVMQLQQKNEWDKIEQKALAGDKAMLLANEYKESALHMASQPHNPQPKALAALIKLAPKEILNQQAPTPRPEASFPPFLFC